MRTQDELKGILSFVMSRTVPLAIENGFDQGVQGTGALFRLGGKPYFVTACHVLEKLDFEKVGIPIAPADLVVARKVEGKPLLLKQAEIRTFRKATIAKPFDPRYDVAVVILEDQGFVAALEQTWTFLTAGNFLRPGERAGGYLVCGFPISIGRRVGDSTLFPPLAIWTHRISAPKEAIAFAAAPDPDTEVFFAYDKQALRSGQTIGSPELHGISGSVVWAVLQGDETSALWTPERQVRVAAIEFAFCHSRYVRAMKLNVLQRLFREIDAPAAREIAAAIYG